MYKLKSTDKNGCSYMFACTHDILQSNNRTSDKRKKYLNQ